MKVDISKAGIQGSPHNDLIISVESLKHVEGAGKSRPRGFRVVFEGGAEIEFRNVREICSALNIEPECLRAAVESEGYEIDGYEIKLISMDAHGAIRNEGEHVERTSEGWIGPRPGMSLHAYQTQSQIDLEGSGVSSSFLQAGGGKTLTALAEETEGNPFERIALDLARLVADKQRQYGDSVGRTGAILRILYPEGIPPDAFDRALLITRCLDKFSRLATNKKDLGGESPWRDVMGYALLAIEKGF